MRTLSDEDVEAIANAVAARLASATSVRIEPDKIYKTAAAAAVLSIHPKTLARYVREGRLKAKGGKYLFKGSELLRLA